jgi:Ca2+-binding RTX toxin-like protein
VLNLGTGTDTVVLGSASEKVFGGGGTALVQATAAFAGAQVIGKATGTTTLEIAGGGTAALNVNDTHLTVKLDAATVLTLSKAAFVTALGSNGNDTIAAGAAGQVLTGGAGADTLTGFSGFGDTFSDTSAGLNGDLLKLFGGSDKIDLTDMAFASLKPLAFAAGVLTVADGTHTAKIDFTGSYTLANFHAATDTHTGTLISFVP